MYTEMQDEKCSKINTEDSSLKHFCHGKTLRIKRYE